MKRSNVFILAAVSLLIISVIAVGAVAYVHQYKNAAILQEMLDSFVETVSADSSEQIIESKSVYGKLNGNGNGIQYFGAVLVHKDSIKDMDSLISRLDNDFETVGYFEQDDNRINTKYLQHRNLCYESFIDKDSDFITIFFFNSKAENSDEGDVLGH